MIKNDNEEPKLPPPPENKDNKGSPNRQNGHKKPQRPSIGRFILFWALTIILVGSWLYSFSDKGSQDGKPSKRDDLMEIIQNGELKDNTCTFVRSSGMTTVKGTRAYNFVDKKTGIEGPIEEPFEINILPEEATDLIKELKEYNEKHQNHSGYNEVAYNVEYKTSYWGDFLIQLAPVLLFFLIIFFIFRRDNDGGTNPLSFGQSRARRLDPSKKKYTFNDVAGIDEAKEEVSEIVDFLKDPARFANLGGRIPHGVLLMGPPGTGKTLLAKAIAGEAGVPFFSISGSDFVEMFVGVGASRVRDMFEQAKKNSPCIIFIDEIDAVGRSRFTGIGGGHDEREQTLNAMLVEMDGFDTNEGIIVMAATNRPDVLDQALLRPGRFDRQIVIDLPTLEGRKKILAVHAKKVALSPTIHLDRVARATPGFSGADLANLLNEAALLAARRKKDFIEDSEIEDARDKVCFGVERRGRMLDNAEQKLTAYHEAGHAIVAAKIEGSEPVHKITIIPRGMSLGSTMFLPEKDRNSYTKTQMLAHLATSMGGRVAEELFLDDISSGASQDLRQATQLAHSMVCDWGMSEKLGPRTFGKREEMMFLGREVGREQDFSESTAQKIDAEVDALVRDAHEKAVKILKENEKYVRTLAEALLEHETIDDYGLNEILKHGRLLTEEERTQIRRDAMAAPSENGILGVVFDYGGVLVRPPRASDMEDVLKKAGISWEKVKEGFAKYRANFDRGDYDCVEMYKKIFADNGTTLKDDLAKEIVDADTASWTHPFEGTQALMEDLKAKGYKIGILTNMCEDFAKNHFRQVCEKETALADAIVISSEERISKPDAAIYKIMEERIGIPPANLLFVDDMEKNCEAAKMLGWESIVYTSPSDVRDFLEKKNG